jgi:hypothetical protein
MNNHNPTQFDHNFFLEEELDMKMIPLSEEYSSFIKQGSRNRQDVNYSIK